MADLRESHRRRKGAVLIERCRSLLGDRAPERRRMALVKLVELRQAGFTESQALLQAHRAVESSDELVLLINQALGETTESAVTTKQQELLTQLVTGDARAWREFETFAWSEKHDILRRGLALGDARADSFLKQVLLCVDPAVRSAAIDLAAGLVPTVLQPFLTGLLQGEDSEIQGAALRALAVVDRARALPVFETFLFSAHAVRRAVAFDCLDSFDFSTVRPLFVRAVCREQNDENRTCIETILMQHLEESLFHEVFACWRSDSVPVPALEPILKRWAESLVQAGATRATDALSLWRTAAHLAEERRQRESSGAEYSVERIQSLRSSSKPEAELVVSVPLSAELVDLARPGATARFLTLWRMNAGNWPA
ncbi:MAG TPA: HEAT repeat domain-containing protein, partial [Candidatus Ozemobacteraceae bacterium]|nr:HEAT repeat domain-containing protein [Candidatus Ozemobacteraceae bacterium]